MITPHAAQKHAHNSLPITAVAASAHSVLIIYVIMRVKIMWSLSAFFSGI